MARVQRTVFGRVFRLGDGGAAAAVGRGVALGHCQEWFAAIADPAADDAQGAALALDGAGGPVDLNGEDAEFAEA